MFLELIYGICPVSSSYFCNRIIDIGKIKIGMESKVRRLKVRLTGKNSDGSNGETDILSCGGIVC